jgi:hypothetical protein
VSEPLPPLAARAASAQMQLVRTLERALAKKPADRFESAGAMAAALREDGRAEPVRAVGEHRRVDLPPSMLEPPRKIPRLRPENDVTSRPEDRHASRAARAEAQASRAADRSLSPLRNSGLPVPPRPPVPLVGAGVPAWAYSVPAGSPSIAAYAERFRTRAMRIGMLLLFLTGLNVATQGGPWVIFPAAGLLLSLRARFRPLADVGLTMRQVLFGGAEAAYAHSAAGSAPVHVVSESFTGRARRFVRRVKLAAIGAGTSVISVLVGSAIHADPNGVLSVMAVVGALTSVLSGIGALRASSPMVAAGFKRRELWKGTWRDSAAARQPAVAYRLREEELAQLAAPEIVASAHGDRLRLAVDDRSAIRHQLLRLDSASAGVLGEVMPVADGLVERVVALTVELHRMDRDLGATDTRGIDERVAALRATGVSSDDRTLSLLLRQQQSWSSAVPVFASSSTAPHWRCRICDWMSCDSAMRVVCLSRSRRWMPAATPPNKHVRCRKIWPICSKGTGTSQRRSCALAWSERVQLVEPLLNFSAHAVMAKAR